MAKLRVIFVHGMSSHVLEEKKIGTRYYFGLRNAIIRKLKKLGVVPQDAAESNNIEGILTFDYAHYSDVGQREEEAVLKAYREARPKLFGFLDMVADKALYHVRLQLVTAFSDVLVYRSDHWGDTIRSRVFEKLDPHVGSGEAISIIAHSLGSPVAFDTVYNQINDGAWKGRGFRLANLFVMGSPIALFAMKPDDSPDRAAPADVLRERANEPTIPWESLLLENAHPVARRTTADEPAPAGAGLSSRLNIISDNGVLYHFMDAQDLLAYPLEAFFRGKVAYDVEDIAVGNGLDPITAHTAYWDNDEVAERIAARLKKDFERE